MEKHRITTISYGDKAKNNVRKLLDELASDIFEITSYSCQEYLAERSPPTDKVVLLTAPIVEDLVRDHLPRDAVVFVAKRSIDPSRLMGILGIPQGSDVLVVNNMPRNAAEVVEELRALGFDHLNLTAHDPMVETGKSFQYAITPDEKDLVPPGIPHIYNIGTRYISLMTLAQLLFYFNHGEIPDVLLAQRYTKPLVTMSADIFQNQKKNMALQDYMDILLSNIDDGTIITNVGGDILFCNNRAKNMLSDEELIGKNIRGISPGLSENESRFINSETGIIYLSKTAYQKDGVESGYIITLKNADDISEIDNKLSRYKKTSGLSAKFSFANIVHQSRVMKGIVTIAERFARKESTILLTGESGTGKELFAQALHNASLRKDGPFVALNCAALSENLLESELFGYEEGAFTGASKGGKKGLFEIANSGTIFLDEIGDAPMTIQTKMLRVLQEREVMRISGNRTIPVNVRVVAATNRELRPLVAEGTFRKDLFYRLNVINLNIPPLRERDGDIDLLLDYFLKQHGNSIKNLDGRTLSLLRSYAWPGNIRELKNIVEYMATAMDITASLYDDVAQILRYEPTPRSAPKSAPASGAKSPLLFRNPAFKKDVLIILSILEEAKKDERIFGRNKIQIMLEQRGHALSIQQVKTRLGTMQRHGLIETTTGRGTCITEEGESYLALNGRPGTPAAV